jgi:uncharacterized protein YbjT (DUF2867 family)
MAKKNYAIMGATGRIGAVIAEELLKKGHGVRALGRDANKLQELKEKGAEIISLSFDDEKALTQAFQECDAIFSLLPSALNVEDYSQYRDKVSASIIQAIQNANVHNVLDLSSIRADLTEGTGPIKDHHRHEERLNKIKNLNVLHIRPGYFMENLFLFIPLIKREGIIASYVKAHVPLAMIAVQDIGNKCADFLDGLKFKGQINFEFLGPQEVTLSDATKMIAKAIRKPDLKYVELSYADAEKKMLTSGLNPKTAKVFLEMHQTFNKGLIKPTEKLTPEHIGKTTIEQFMKIFPQVYEGTSTTKQ